MAGVPNDSRLLLPLLLSWCLQRVAANELGIPDDELEGRLQQVQVWGSGGRPRSQPLRAALRHAYRSMVGRMPDQDLGLPPLFPCPPSLHLPGQMPLPTTAWRG